MLTKTGFAASVLAFAALPASAQRTTFDFNAPSRLAATSGPGVLSYRGTTGSVVRFGTCASFGIPLLPGGDSAVMLVPSLTAAQGLALDHAGGPNGPHAVDGWVSNYSIVMDVLIPGATFGQLRALLNTNPSNSNDADFFINASGAVGVGGRFNGEMQPNRWHRIAITVGAAGGGSESLPAEGMASQFIDGKLVGGQGGTGAAIDGGRWALYSQPGADLVIFGDDNGQTAPLYVSSIMFVTERLSQAEIAALGGPTAQGITVPGAAPTITPGTARRVGIIAHRGNSGDAPENSMAAIEQAIEIGAEAIEMDIRLSSDGVVMLMHDSTVNRTTTGTGNASSLTAAQIGALDNGSWFDDRYAGQRPPTLVQALTRLRGTGVKAYLDVKVSGMANEIRAAMQQAGVTEQDVWLWAYSSAAVAEYNSVFTRPQIVTGDTPSTLAGWQSLRVQNVVGVDLGFGTSQLSDPTFYANARAAGMWVSAYTVVDPRTMLTLINASVDRMETDYPALLNSLMRPACPADVNGDSSVDGDDVIAFSTGWDAGNYDFNGDGGTDGDDVIAFFGRWDAGC